MKQPSLPKQISYYLSLTEIEYSAVLFWSVSVHLKHAVY